MGKRQVHVVVVRKPVTIVLLAVLTLAMAASVYELAGRGFVRESRSTRELVAAAFQRAATAGMTSNGMLALLMPVFADALVFVPWGFLAFVAVDRPSMPRGTAHAITLAAGIVLALAFEAWQFYLPTRISAPSDVFANAAGTLAGSVLGHLRKQVRIRFDL